MPSGEILQGSLCHCPNETWLDEVTPDAKGGGVCMYIIDRLCKNIKIHSKICTPDVEMLTLSLRCFHLAREFSTIVISCLYVPPSANYDIAAEIVASTISDMQLSAVLPPSSCRS